MYIYIYAGEPIINHTPITIYIYKSIGPGAISPIPSDKDDIVLPSHLIYLHGSPGRDPGDPTLLATMSLRVRSEACEGAISTWEVDEMSRRFEWTFSGGNIHFFCLIWMIYQRTI